MASCLQKTLRKVEVHQPEAWFGSARLKSGGSPTRSMFRECMVEELIEYAKNAEIKHFPNQSPRMK